MYAMANPSFRRKRDFVGVVTALVEARVKCRDDDVQRRDKVRDQKATRFSEGL